MKWNFLSPGRISVSLLSILITSLVLSSCSTPQETTLRVGTNSWPGYEPLYLAQQWGFYQRSDIRIAELTSATQVQRAFRNRLLEVAALTLDEALQLRQSVPDLRIILVTDISHGADAILAKPDIRALTDLKQRRVGVENTALGALVLQRALEQANLSVDQIHLLSLTHSHHERAFLEGKVDAVVTFEPVRSRLLQHGAHILFDSSQMPNQIIDVLVTRQTTLQSHSHSLRALVAGYFQALERVRANAPEALAFIAKRLQLSIDELQHSYRLMRQPMRADNLRLLGQGADSLQPSLNDLLRLMLRERLLDRPVDIRHILTPAVLRGQS